MSISEHVTTELPDAAQASIRRSRAGPGGRGLAIGLIVVLCTVIAVGARLAVEHVSDRLISPEVAMYGIARADAYLHTSLILYGTGGALSILALVCLFRKRIRGMAVVPAIAFLPVYAGVRDARENIESVPQFHLTFSGNEGNLDQFADKIVAGERPTLPAKVGAYVIVAAEQLPGGGVALLTKEDATWDAKWGFVRYPELLTDSGPAELVGCAGDSGRENRIERLRGDWFVIYHLYWFIKRGWS